MNKNARRCKFGYRQNCVQFPHLSHIMLACWKSKCCRYQNLGESSKKCEIYGKVGRKCQKWLENMLLRTQVLRNNRFGQTPTTPSMTPMLLSTDPPDWKHHNILICEQMIISVINYLLHIWFAKYKLKTRRKKYTLIKFKSGEISTKDMPCCNCPIYYPLDQCNKSILVL